MGTFSENVPIRTPDQGARERSGRIELTEQQSPSLQTDPSRSGGARPDAIDRGALTAVGIRKAYGATVALQRGDITLKGGEVHALLGENGAGKSTLVRILTGAVAADSGEMRLDGELYSPRSINEARAYQVATAFQELSLVSNLTVAQNLLLPSLPKGRSGLVSASRVLGAAGDILARFDLSRIDPRREVASLPLADRQRLEIVRAMNNAGRVLILDEPTASLAETDWLFGQIRRATAQGVAVLYISHRLAEVREICESATVLRNGETIATVGLGEASDADIFEMMVGRRIAQEHKVVRSLDAAAAVRLSIKGLTSHDAKDVSLDLRAGEVLGIAALEGQGQRSLFRALAGLDPLQSGTVEVDGKPAHLRSPRAAMKSGSGMVYLPEERKTEGILAGLTAASNIVLPILPKISLGLFVGERTELKSARPAGERIEMDPRYLSFAIGDLSGGNQQKALIARALATGAKTLLLFDPTRGVDVGTKESIYAAIRVFADGGGSVLFYSSELSELVQLADRCAVLYGGRVFAVFDGEEIEEQRLVSAMTGHSLHRQAEQAPQ